jgi:hypothetical protein
LTAAKSYINAWNDFSAAVTAWVPKLDLVHDSLVTDSKRGPQILSVQSRRYIRAADKAFKAVKSTWQAFDNTIR